MKNNISIEDIEKEYLTKVKEGNKKATLDLSEKLKILVTNDRLHSNNKLIDKRQKKILETISGFMTNVVNEITREMNKENVSFNRLEQIQHRLGYAILLRREWGAKIFPEESERSDHIIKLDEIVKSSNSMIEFMKTFDEKSV